MATSDIPSESFAEFSAKQNGHSPVLDGLRGLAILMVLSVHFVPDYLMPNRPFEWAKKFAFCGWIGVDLFFVLSGFLITGILLKNRTSPQRIRNFYGRRVLRIMPLYLGSLFIVFAILPWLAPTDARFTAMQTTQGWYWIHSANVVALLYGFNAMMSDTVYLSHFWSLAVEEHFYLVWPLVVWRFSERQLAWSACGIILSALLLRTACIPFLEPAAAAGLSVQTPARIDALAIGGLLVLVLQRNSPITIRQVAWSVMTLAGICLGAIFLIQKGLWPTSLYVSTIGLTLIAFAFAALIAILLTSAPQGIGNRIFSNGVLRFFGKYSYGIYVLHGLLTPQLYQWFPKDELLATTGSPVIASAIIFAGKTAVSVAAAIASWHLLERPFLRMKRYFEYGHEPLRLSTR